MTETERYKDHAQQTAPLRIALVTPAWPGIRTANGIATVVAHMADGLEACGHKVMIIPMTIDAPHDFARVVPLPEQHWTLVERLQAKLGLGVEEIVHRKISRQIATAVQQAVERHAVQVVVIEETQGWAAEIRRLTDIPVVATLHGPWALLKAYQSNGVAWQDLRRVARERAALARVQAVTAPSRNVLGRMQAGGALLDIPTAVIANPVSVPEHRTHAPVERMLFVGRFDRTKGGDLIIAAFAAIATRHSTCTLTFAGPDIGIQQPGQPRIGIKDALAALPADVRNRIDVRGQCSREQIAALRQNHGLTVVASRYETFGGTIFEAMGAGSPLVCTDACGGAELLEDGRTALVVPAGDAQAIAAGCLALLDDRDRAARMGLAAREFVETSLSPTIIGRQMADFLRPLCRKG